MKKTFNSWWWILPVMVVMVMACGKDDDDNDKPEGEIPVSVLDGAISILGATRVSGELPDAQGDMSITPTGNLVEGFLNTGFLFGFTVPDDVAGLYVRFKDSEGNLSSGYYRINADGNKKNHEFKAKDSPLHVRINKVSQAITADLNFNLFVTFNQNMPVGRFCFDISAFDTQGNVSEARTVCVEVLPWGGNASLAGEWIFDRLDPPSDEDESVALDCDGGGQVSVLPVDYAKNDWIMVLNSDGSYYEENHIIGSVLNEAASRADCAQIYEEASSELNYQYWGNWAYSQANSSFTLVDFGYRNLLNPSDDNNYPSGEFYFLGINAAVVSGELVLTVEGVDAQGNPATQSLIFRSM